MFDKIFKNKTIIAVACIVIGFILMIFQNRFTESAIRFLGYILIGAGIAYLVSWLMGKRTDEAKLGYAILAGGAGLTIILLGKAIVNALPVIVGSLLILNGVANLIQLKNGNANPKYSKFDMIAMIVVGGIFVINPWAGNRLIYVAAGACLILNGLADLDLISRFWQKK